MPNLIPATTNAVPAGPATEFTVTDQTSLHCFPENGSEFVGVVKKKNSDGTYTSLMAVQADGKAATTVSLDQINSSVLVVSKGTYAFDKSETSTAIGIDTES